MHTDLLNSYVHMGLTSSSALGVPENSSNGVSVGFRTLERVHKHAHTHMMDAAIL